MAIGSLGVASGLDLESLVTKLIQTESQPRLASLASREAKVQSNISAFGSLKSSLDKLRTAAKALSDADALGRPAVNTGGSSLFSATGTAEASTGLYSIQVLNRAVAQKLSSTADFSSGTDLVGEGKLSITVGGKGFTITTSDTTTLSQLRDAINSDAANTGVSASLLVVAKDPQDPSAGTVTRLVLTARTTGLENTIETSVEDVDLGNTDNAGLSRFYFSASDALNSQLSQTQPAANARIAIDGFTVYSNTNTFEDAIEGVTLTVLKEPADPQSPPVESLTVSGDSTTASGRLQAFVAAYNDLARTIKALSGYNADTKAAGTLNGDSTVRNIARQLRVAVGAPGAAGDGDLSLAQIGVAFQSDGTIKVDANKLDTALKDSLPAITTFLTGDKGFGSRLDTLLGGYLDKGGLIEARTNGFDQQIKSIGKDRESVLARMELLDATYRKRFAALDSLVARTKSSGDYLLAQLKSTSTIISGKNN